jgi:aminotransferase
MTGWRIGYICAPSEILEGILKVHQYMIMSAATVAQDAALEALKTGEPDVARMLGHYDRRRRIIVDGFNEIGLTCFEPRGAFYAFPQITSTGLTSDQFAEQLIREESVAVVPGNAFGAAGESHVRCCYATSEAEIKEALVRIGRFVERRKVRDV